MTGPAIILVDDLVAVTLRLTELMTRENEILRGQAPAGHQNPAAREKRTGARL